QATSADAEHIRGFGALSIAHPNWREVRNECGAKYREARISEGECCRRRGLLVAFCLPEAGSARLASEERVFRPNAFLQIGTDGIVTVILGKSEMGTGIYTSLSMLVADELDAEWRNVHVEAAPVDKVYFHPTFHMQMTGGSSRVTSEWERLRKAGATARMMLLMAAAQQWEVDPRTCHTERSYVIHVPTCRKLSYGSLANLASSL